MTCALQFTWCDQFLALKMFAFSLNEEKCEFSENLEILKGKSGLSTSWAQTKEHEKSKRTSHH